ncbi:MAG: efflux RND transporter permease subunit [Candidatus Cryptobacteroides sp.]
MLKTLLDRPVSVTMMMLVVVVLGIVSMRLLPVSLIPDVDIPYITVQAVSSQMSAREMDESVVKTLRQQLMQVGGVEEITAESRDGAGLIRLSFSHGSNMDYAFVEVNEKIDRCMSSLPDMDRPKVLKASATDIPAFYINLTPVEDTEDAFNQISRFARDVICKRLEQQEEVAMVDMSGYADEQIMIIPDQGKLAQLGLTQEQFENIINSSNIHLGSLTIHDGQYRYNVKFLSSVTNCEDIANIWFRTGERVMQIKDIASVEQQPAKKTGLIRSDGKRAVCMAIIKQGDARMSDLQDSMERLISEFENDYPQIKFTVTRDQTRLLEYSINNLVRNIIAGVILACLVIFLFMRDFRSPALVSLTMPVALIFSMAVFYVMGLSINIISLSGLLLGVGMMVDNTIILVDNITGRWQRGDSLKGAVIEGTGEVAGPMLSSVLTTCAVFIPLVFVSGIAGELFFDQAMAVTIVLLTSYIVTLTVIPVYYYWLYRRLPSFRSHPLLGSISIDEPLRRWDRKIMEWFMDHRAASWGILAVSGVGIVLCFAFMKKERLPEMTYTETIMTIDWNEQISIEENERRVASIEDMIKEECLQTTSMVGMQKFILSHSGELGTGEASIYVNCVDMKTLDGVKTVMTNAVSEEYPSAAYRFEVSGNIFDAVFADSEAPLVARIRPASLPRLEVEGVRGLLGELRKNLSGVHIEDVPVKTDALFIADAQKMALYDVSYSELSSFLKNSLNENKLFSIVQGTRTIPVLTGDDAGSLAEILSDKSIVSNGVRIPVSELMRQTYVEDFKTVVSGAEGNYYPVSLEVDADKVPETMEAVDSVVGGDGRYEVSYSGSWFSNRKMVSELLLVLIIAVVLLYLILASQFESLLQPLLILSEIVVDMFSSLLVLWALGMSINLMSMIGLVVICGIVINDSILKIDTINRMRKDGYALRQAITEAGGRRMKAIIMTSLTTILAVSPFLGRGSMGDDLQYPMSVVIIVGMTAGTLVSLFVLPALYYSIYNRKKISPLPAVGRNDNSPVIPGEVNPSVIPGEVNPSVIPGEVNPSVIPSEVNPSVIPSEAEESDEK